MTAKKAFEYRCVMVQNVVEVFRRAEIFGTTSQQLSEELLQITRTAPEDLPYHVRAYVSGYADCLRSRMVNEQLEFCYIHADGRRVSIRKASPLYYETLGYSARDSWEKHVKSGFFWITTGKCYSIHDRETV